MRHFQSCLVAAALCLFIPSGCGNSSDGSDGSSAPPEASNGDSNSSFDDSEGELRITRQEVCAATECSQSSVTTCNECLNACFDAMMEGVYLDCESSCNYSCEPRDCTGSPCVATDYVFTVTGLADADTERLCVELLTRFSSRGPGDGDRALCHEAAQVYEPSTVVPYFECEFRDGCPGDGSYAPPPLGTVGDEYCEAVKALGSKCDVDLRYDLSKHQRFYQTAAVDALRTCFAESSKSAIESCALDWRSLGYVPLAIPELF